MAKDFTVCNLDWVERPNLCDGKEPSNDKLPKLWILTPTLSDRSLESVGALLELE